MRTARITRDIAVLAALLGDFGVSVLLLDRARFPCTPRAR